MSIKNYYYLDKQTCELIPVRYNSFERIITTTSLWILCGLVLAGVGIIGLSQFVGTPSEIALKAENKELLYQLNITKNTLSVLDGQLDHLSQRDNEIYRTMLGMDAISEDERRGGTGGADIYQKFDNLSQSSSQILKWTAENLDQIERRVNIQKVSFEEIKAFYNENQVKLSHLPAIRPLKGIITSSFGMRLHPVHKYYRMHKGMDFRARRGTPIYATGDGKIAYSTRKGNLGLAIKIDHGFGFESRYGHLSGFADGIKKGVRVKRGQLIGYSGNTGVTAGPHLHYEIFKNGKVVDPINYLFGDITPEEYNEFLRIGETNPNSMD